MDSLRFGFYNSKGKEDISIINIILYIFFFFIPIVLGYFFSSLVSEFLSIYIHVSANVSSEIMMMFLTLVIFFFLIPIVRVREGIRGVRFGLFLFLIISLLMTIPPLYKGYYNFLFIQLVYIANFILATFMNCPDVIGISGDTENWFKHKVQLMILLIYSSIVMFYIMGFAFMYYEISIDPEYPNAFSYDAGISPSYTTFLYYSIITFTTIGYGDITPLSNAARLVTGLEAMVGMIINVVFIAILLVFVTNFSLLEEKLNERRIRNEEKQIKKEEEEIKKEERLIKKEEREIVQDMTQFRISPQSHQEGQGGYQNNNYHDIPPKNNHVSRYPNYLDGE